MEAVPVLAEPRELVGMLGPKSAQFGDLHEDGSEEAGLQGVVA